jgi:exopolysaccharide production protein ExoZ
MDCDGSPLSVDQDRLPGIQIARAVAALAIAYLHSWHVTMPFPAGSAFPIPILKDHGALGVDLFFAISGFVICIMATSRNFNPVSFAILRIFRLYPLWIITSLAFLLLTRFIGRAPDQTIGYFFYSLTLLPTSSLPFYDLGWTLQHEIAFYLLAMIVAPKFGPLGIAVALVSGMAADKLIPLPWYLHNYVVFYASFLAGIAAFLLRDHVVRLGVVLPMGMSIAILVASEFALGRESRALLFPGLFFGLIAFINMKPRSLLGTLGKTLGDASYSIYLIHALVFYTVYILLKEPLPPIWTQEFIRFGSIIAICFLSIVSWHFFESPMIALGAGLSNYFRFRGGGSILSRKSLKPVSRLESDS